MKRLRYGPRRAVGIAATVLLLGLGSAAMAQEGRIAPQDLPGPLKEVGFDQNLGDLLPLDARFVDDRGRQLALGELFGDKPVVLAFVYYECPMLCSLVMNGLAKSLGVLAFDLGNEFDVVAISIDPGETPAHAAEVKATTARRYARPGTEDGWHFLTGSQEEIERVTEAAGFRYVYLPEDDEYAHTSGILIATPDGTIAQYFYGFEYPPKDVRLALVEASSSRIGSVVDQVMLYCFRYDPKLGKYTAVTMRIVRLGGVIFCLMLAVFFWIMWRLERSAGRRQTSLGAA